MLTAAVYDIFIHTPQEFASKLLRGIFVVCFCVNYFLSKLNDGLETVLLSKCEKLVSMCIIQKNYH